MADNIQVTPGAGTDIRFRAISAGTVYAQMVDTAPWVATAVGGGATAFTVGTTSLGTTGLSIGTATHVFLSVEPNAPQGVRFWNSGDTPTLTLGHYLAPGTGPLEIDNAANLQVIASGTSGSTIMLSRHVYL